MKPLRTPVREILACGALALAGLAVFGRALGHEFLSWDDPLYVTENARVTAGLTLENLRWALTGFAAANWHPLTWLSHMTDVELFGLDPRGHHATSVVLHVTNSLLVFLLLRAATGAHWRSLLVAALFALHPLRVESVAWVSERKDLLSTFFWLLAIAAYGRYARRPGAGAYALVAVAMILGLMAKPMVVTLPMTLLLLDIWPLRRVSTDRVDAQFARRLGVLVLEKLPLLVLSAGSAVLTVLAQRSAGAISSTEAAGIDDRLANSALSYAAYLKQFVVPTGLSFFYPYRDDWSTGAAALSAVVLITVSAAAVRWARERPELIVGWLWYLVTLIPVIGLVQVGAQAMADRYTYMPLAGIFVACAWMLPEPAGGRWSARQLASWAAAGCAVAAFGVRAFMEVGYWKDSRTLYARAVEVDPSNYVAHSMLAADRLQAGDTQRAERHAREAIRLAESKPPGRAAAILSVNYATLGAVAARQNDLPVALEHYRRATELDPRNAAARYGFGNTLARLGEYARAIDAFRKVLEVDSGHARAHNAIGFALLTLGRTQEAVGEYRRALALNPALPEVHFNLGVALEVLGSMPEALAAYRESVRLEPRNVTARLRLGRLLRLAGQSELARREFEAALALDPNNALARRLLAETGG